jgi:hypothetical protein
MLYLYKRNIMKLTKEQILGIVRHALTFVGGIFVMKGLIEETVVTEIVGGAMTLTGAIWSIVEKA